jgi:transcription initiation factor TFIIB
MDIYKSDNTIIMNKTKCTTTQYPYKPYTKKRRSVKKNTKDIWAVFDDETELKDNIECIYDSSITNREKCDKCESTVALSIEGYFICVNKNCGILYKDTLDQSAEWRFYGAGDNNNNDPTRCGMPINPLLKESSFGCKVMCNGRSSYEMRKIRRYTEWQSMPYKEKSQYDEFERIKIMANNSGIPKFIIDDALIYHKKISEQKTFRALNRDGIIAASIYISGRINNFPRTSKEIATIFNLDNTSATKGCKNALTIINKMEKNMISENKTILHQTKPISFIERYCSKLNINKELTKLCMFIAMRVEKNNMMPENTPHSVAAGIVYFIGQVCNLNMSKNDVKNISEISEVTINKCYKKLGALKDTLIPSSIKNKYCN